MKCIYVLIITCVLLGCSNKTASRSNDSKIDEIVNSIVNSIIEEKRGNSIISFDYDHDIENNIYTISVNKLTLEITSDYAIWLEDGNTENANRINEHNPLKIFSLTVFDKDNDYNPEGPNIFSAEFCRRIEKYMNNEIEMVLPEDAYRIITINNIKMFDYITLCEYITDNTTFKRNLVFFDDIYCYNVYINYEPESNMKKEMPEYFEEHNYQGINNNPFIILSWNYEMYKNLLENIKNFEPLPEYLSNLINDSDKILITIKLE